MTSRITVLATVAMIIMSTASCEQEKYDNSIPRVEGIALDVTASIDGRLWQYGDRVEIIDSLGNSKISLPAYKEACAENTFRIENWKEGSAPAFLYWANSSLPELTSTVIPLELPASREASGEPSTDIALGYVTAEAGFGKYICSMFNPLSSICLSISSKQEIESISMSSKEGLPLCGTAELDLKTISNGKVDFSVKDSGNTLTLTCGNRCFVPGRSYYTAILPDLEFTPVFTFTDTLGRKAVKTMRNKISTSETVRLSAIDDGIEFDPTKIRPDTISMKLEFGNWTLTPDLPGNSTGESSTDGETYTYHYVSAAGYEANYPFIICKGTASGAGYYSYSNASGIKAIKFDKTTAWIALPVISGMRIHRIALSNINSTNKGFKFQTVKGYTSSESDILFSAQYCNSTKTCEFNGSGQKETAEDQQYFIYFYYGTGGVWSDLSIEYTKVEEL